MARKNWIVVDAELIFIHVYDLSNWKKIKSFVAHDDRITCIVVHNRLPYIASASDDGTIKLWDWENDWLVRMFDHSNCVKHITFCPSESTTFASACLDGSLKVDFQSLVFYRFSLLDVVTNNFKHCRYGIWSLNLQVLLLMHIQSRLIQLISSRVLTRNI